VIYFVSKGLPYKDHIEEYVFPTRNIVNFLINFTFFTATYLSEAQYGLSVLKVLLNLNQSISQSLNLVSALFVIAVVIACLKCHVYVYCVCYERQNKRVNVEKMMQNDLSLLSSQASTISLLCDF